MSNGDDEVSADAEVEPPRGVIPNFVMLAVVLSVYDVSCMVCLRWLRENEAIARAVKWLELSSVLCSI